MYLKKETSKRRKKNIIRSEYVNCIYLYRYRKFLLTLYFLIWKPIKSKTVNCIHLFIYFSDRYKERKKEIYSQAKSYIYILFFFALIISIHMLILSDKKIDDDQDDLSSTKTVQKQITGNVQIKISLLQILFLLLHT